jgi:polyhydroxyalkanoate synthase
MTDTGRPGSDEPDAARSAEEPTAAVPFSTWLEWLGTNVSAPSAQADPLMAALAKMWESAPMSNIVPVDWAGITQALQTLWQRELSDPARAMERATEYNRQLFETMTKVWTDAASRFWGVPGAREEQKRRPDKRFAAPEWESNPFYKTLKETYLLASDYLMREAEESDGHDTEEQRRLKFHLRQFVEAMAPANLLLTNPAALQRVLETGGLSLMDGARNLASDLEEGRLSMVDATAFKVGENLATSPGKVVFRNELIELIQYEPRTEQVREVPILFVPPWINKFYILDLSENNSLVRHLVGQGFTVFMISWKNPDASMEGTSFADYMTSGPLTAAGVAREITGSERVNPTGYCIGGTLLAMTLAWLAAGDDEEAKRAFGDPTFMVTLLDFAEVGDTEVFIDEPQFEAMEMQMMERGYLDDRKLANMFNLLRSSDLIWANVINNYLLGRKPPALDLLYWNSDGTRMAREAHAFYLRNTYLENNLVEPGKVELLGRRLDLGKITSDVYAIGAEKDHIVPWKSAWKLTRLVGGESPHFTLAGSGHIAGMISPPEKARGYRIAPDRRYESAEDWHANTEARPGTWWEHWCAWLNERSGEHREPPRMGSDQHPPLEDAPGTYVLKAQVPAGAAR